MASKNNNQSWFWRMWSESKIFQVLVFLVPAAIVFVVVRKVKRDKKYIDQNRYDDQVIKDIMTEDGVDESAASNTLQQLKDIAQGISTAFFDFEWRYILGQKAYVKWKLDEDEEEAIRYIYQCRNASDVRKVSDLYNMYNAQFEFGGGLTSLNFTSKGKSLAADMKSYLSNAQYTGLPSFIRNNLK
ncbi:MAG: hypothetical protein J0H92_07905 [Sphingobacteriales bacterium]|nr:hypothetical protein [Sphingobacteriales bacterium]OJW30083.1 MAG: hypothetical protein BGO54_00360 [Sphingobacteriales bacterium 46-32]